MAESVKPHFRTGCPWLEQEAPLGSKTPGNYFLEFSGIFEITDCDSRGHF